MQQFMACSLHLTLLRLIHVVAITSGSSLFEALLFFCLSSGGHLKCFQILAVIDKQTVRFTYRSLYSHESENESQSLSCVDSVRPHGPQSTRLPRQEGVPEWVAMPSSGGSS